jgi:hypothetical protein
MTQDAGRLYCSVSGCAPLRFPPTCQAVTGLSVPMVRAAVLNGCMRFHGYSVRIRSSVCLNGLNGFRRGLRGHKGKCSAAVLLVP